MHPEYWIWINSHSLRGIWRCKVNHELNPFHNHLDHMNLFLNSQVVYKNLTSPFTGRSSLHSSEFGRGATFGRYHRVAYLRIGRVHHIDPRSPPKVFYIKASSTQMDFISILFAYLGLSASSKLLGCEILLPMNYGQNHSAEPNDRPVLLLCRFRWGVDIHLLINLNMIQTSLLFMFLRK